jgi:hypothetical protein
MWLADAEGVNSIASTSRKALASRHQPSVVSRSPQALARRLAAWWSHDQVSAGFAAARARDEQLPRRHT